MATIFRFVDTNSAPGGDGTTNSTAGANRAYSSLSEWEAAEQTNLVSAGDIMDVSCAGGADSTDVSIAGWTTGASNYILIHATTDKHDGVFDASKYHFTGDTGSGASFTVSEEFTRIEDLQLDRQVPGGSGSARQLLRYAALVAGDLRVNRNIFRYDSGASTAIIVAINVADSSPDYTITDNIFDNRLGASSPNARCIDVTGGSATVDFYNNTVINWPTGFQSSNNTCVLKNNIFQDCTSDIAGTLSANSNYNLTDNVSIVGANSVDNATLTFEDKAAFNFDLAAGDTDAIGAGIGPSADSIVTLTDIIGEARSGATTDIGAFVFVGGGGGVTVTVTEQGPSFTEAVNATITQAVLISANISESGPSFTELANVTINSNLTAAIAEVGPSFTESISSVLTAKLNAAITESGPSFTESIDLTLGSSGISLVDWTSNNTDNATSMVLNVPTGTIDGDVILFLSQTDGNDGFEVPSGFTALDTESTTASSTMVTAYRVASSEPASYVITHANGASERAIGYFASYRNVETSNPIDQTTANNGGSSTNGVLTALTPTNDNSMVVSFIGLETGNAGNPIISSWPSSLIEIADNINGPAGTGSSSSSGSFAQELQATAADVSGNIAISVSSTTWCTTLIALNPIISGAAATITEQGPSFTETISATINANLSAVISEQGPSFVESISVTLTPLTIQADITEQGPSFTEGITVNLDVNLSVLINEQGPSFTESIAANLSASLISQITETGPSFVEMITVLVPNRVTVNPKNTIPVKRKSNTVIIEGKNRKFKVQTTTNTIRVK